MKKLLFLHCITLFFIFCKMHSAAKSEFISKEPLTASQQEIADLARQWVATIHEREHAIKVYPRIAEVAQIPEKSKLLNPHHLWSLEKRQRKENARLYELTVDRCVGSPLGGKLGDITEQMSRLTPAEINAQRLNERLDNTIRRSCR